jgi:hypothetical protein
MADCGAKGVKGVKGVEGGELGELGELGEEYRTRRRGVLFGSPA